jgi:hypothetical protein
MTAQAHLDRIWRAPQRRDRDVFISRSLFERFTRSLVIMTRVAATHHEPRQPGLCFRDMYVQPHSQLRGAHWIVNREPAHG